MENVTGSEYCTCMYGQGNRQMRQTVASVPNLTLNGKFFLVEKNLIIKI